MAADPETQAEIDRTAAAWLARLGSPALDDADRRAFRAWLDADAAHAASFEHARALWDGLGPAAGALAGHERRRASRRRLATATAACALLAAAGLLFRDDADFATAHGAIGTVTLADGSRMTLDGYSAAGVEIGSDRSASASPR